MIRSSPSRPTPVRQSGTQRRAGAGLAAGMRRNGAIRQEKTPTTNGWGLGRTMKVSAVFPRVCAQGAYRPPTLLEIPPAQTNISLPVQTASGGSELSAGIGALATTVAVQLFAFKL